MKSINADVVICGGGLSGLICSLALSDIGISSFCIDKSANIKKKQIDTRSTAYLNPSKEFLDDIGVWKHLSKNANPLKTLSIVNSSTGFPYNNIISETKFNAIEIFQDEFGWNINNNQTKKILLELVEKDKMINFEYDEIINIREFNERLTVYLKNKKQINTKLLIGADGRNSFIRKNYNINADIDSLDQKAITFLIKHEYMHKDISYEIYKTGGPFTTVPLKNDKANTSAVVWVDKTNKINNLLKLNKQEFNKEVNKRSVNKLGDISVISELEIFPVTTQIANKLVDHRMILIGEAAHALPPIGAQGLNLTIKDIKEIYDLCKKNPTGIGDGEMVSKFNIKRLIDIKIRSKSVNFLNKISESNQLLISKTRDLGLNFLGKVQPVKYLLMKFGLG